MYDTNNWVYTLTGFHYEINFKKGSMSEESFKNNRASEQIEVIIRDILSNYKTPILLNEIFK